MGTALVATAPCAVTVISRPRPRLDITCAKSVKTAIREDRPDLIINTAAYTAVDLAETHQEIAYEVNAAGPAVLATAARQAGVRLVQLSTDFVFDGTCGRAYRRTAAVHPLNVYGSSKCAGEDNVRAILPDALIVRTSWIYSAQPPNFVLTMLRLMADRDQIRVVDDQIGTPTHARSLARAIWMLVESGAKGTWHVSDGGQTSWYDFAVAIRDDAFQLGLINNHVEVRRISSAEFASPARRPAFSVLDSSETWSRLEQVPVHWRQELRGMLKECMERK